MKTRIFVGLVFFVLRPGPAQNYPYSISHTDLNTPLYKIGQSSAVQNRKLSSYISKPAGLSMEQAPAHYVYLESERLDEAMEDMAGNLSFEEFIKKYDCKQTEKNLQVTRFKYMNKEKREVTELGSLVAGESGGHHIRFYSDSLAKDSLDLNTGWVFEYRPGTSRLKEAVKAFYFTGGFSSLQFKRSPVS